MGSIRGYLGRHAGVVLALLISSVLVKLGPPKVVRPRVALPEHEARVAEFSADGRIVLTDGASGGCLRDAADGRILARLVRAGGASPATDIAWPRFTADGRHVVVQLGRTSGSGQTVMIAVFEVATGRERASFEGVGSRLWYGTGLPPAEYALSADGSTLAFCRATGFGPGRTGRVTAWDIDAGEVVAEFPGLPPLALTPDGGALAYCPPGADDAPPRGGARPRRAGVPFPTIRTLRPGRPATARIRRPGASAGLGAGPIAFSPDGRLLVAGVSEDPVLIGPALTAFEVRHVGSGRVVAAMDLNLHRRSNLHRHSSFDPLINPQNAWFSPDTRRLLLEDLGGFPPQELIQCWDLSGASPRRALQGPPEGFTPDGARAAIAEFDITSRWEQVPANNSTVDVFDLPSPRARLHLVETGVHKATISPDGRLLALPSDRKEIVGPDVMGPLIRRACLAIGLPPRPIDIHEIRLRDAATGDLVGTIDRGPRRFRPYSATFSPDGKTLVTKDLPGDHKGWRSDRPPIDWLVEFWDIPAGRSVDGPAATSAALTAAVLVLAGARLDRWRDRRRGRESAREAPG